MRLMIASDIHGSGHFASKLLVRYMEESPDRLILLGDILYHGPRNDLPKEYDPRRVANLVKDHILCIKGNCDAEVDSWMLDFPLVSDLGCILVDGITMYLTHGHVYNIENKPPMCPGDVLIFGHTHIPCLEITEKGVFINPGSVALPKEDNEHSYIVYENGVFEWKNLEGELLNRFEIPEN